MLFGQLWNFDLLRMLQISIFTLLTEMLSLYLSMGHGVHFYARHVVTIFQRTDFVSIIIMRFSKWLQKR